MQYEVKWERSEENYGTTKVGANSVTEAINSFQSGTVTSVKPILPEGTPFFTKYIGDVLVFVEGYRNGNLDDLYWSNKFAQAEREQEAKAYLNGPV